MMKENESNNNNNNGSSSQKGETEEEDEQTVCYFTKVTITSDNWPQEITWKIVDIETNSPVITGDNDELVPNEPISTSSCLPSWACYEFIINDAGGDGEFYQVMIVMKTHLSFSCGCLFCVCLVLTKNVLSFFLFCSFYS